MKDKIVILAGNYSSANVVYNALKRDFNLIKVIREENVPRGVLIRRRIKKLGLLTTIGQILFMVMVVPILQNFQPNELRKLKRGMAWISRRLQRIN